MPNQDVNPSAGGFDLAGNIARGVVALGEPGLSLGMRMNDIFPGSGRFLLEHPVAFGALGALPGAAVGGGIGALFPSEDEEGNTHRLRNAAIGAAIGAPVTGIPTGMDAALLSNMLGFNKTSSFATGFIKRAQEYGLSEGQAIDLFKKSEEGVFPQQGLINSILNLFGKKAPSFVAPKITPVSNQRISDVEMAGKPF